MYFIKTEKLNKNVQNQKIINDSNCIVTSKPPSIWNKEIYIKWNQILANKRIPRLFTCKSTPSSSSLTCNKEKKKLINYFKKSHVLMILKLVFINYFENQRLFEINTS